MNAPDRWYYRTRKGVCGPVSRAELEERVDPSTPVCPAGSGAWEPAGRILPETARPSSPEDETEDALAPPTLKRFRRLCRRAPAGALEREWEDHRAAYDHRERRVLREERKRRGDGPKKEGIMARFFRWVNRRRS